MEKQLCRKGPVSPGRQQVEPETCPCGKESKCSLSCISKSIVLRLRQVIILLSSALVCQMWSVESSSELPVQETWMSWGAHEWARRWLGNRVRDFQGESDRSGGGLWRAEGYGGPYWCVQVPDGQALAGHDFQQRLVSDDFQRCFPTSATLWLCSSVNTTPKSWYHQNMELVLALIWHVRKYRDKNEASKVKFLWKRHEDKSYITKSKWSAILKLL